VTTTIVFPFPFIEGSSKEAKQIVRI